MGEILYLVGVVVAGYTGYSGESWFFIFISSFIMAIGYFIVRWPQLSIFYEDQGALFFPKLLTIQICIYCIITAPIYFVAMLLQ